MMLLGPRGRIGAFIAVVAAIGITNLARSRRTWSLSRMEQGTGVEESISSRPIGEESNIGKDRPSSRFAVAESSTVDLHDNSVISGMEKSTITSALNEYIIKDNQSSRLADTQIRTVNLHENSDISGREKSTIAGVLEEYFQMQPDSNCQMQQCACQCGMFQACYPHNVEVTTGQTTKEIDVGICHFAVPVLCIFSLGIFFAALSCVILFRWVANQYEDKLYEAEYEAAGMVTLKSFPKYPSQSLNCEASEGKTRSGRGRPPETTPESTAESSLSSTSSKLDSGKRKVTA